MQREEQPVMLTELERIAASSRMGELFKAERLCMP